MFRNAKRFTAILLVLILAASTYAFAATNTVAPSNAGFGVSVVSGYSVTNVSYTVDVVTDPIIPTVTHIKFTIVPKAPAVAVVAPTVVKISYLAAPAWTAANICVIVETTATTLYTIDCTIAAGGVALALVVTMDVVAYSGSL